MPDVSLMDLWLPILIATAAGFFMSFLLWAVSPHHNAEWKKLPNEDAVMSLIRWDNVPADRYMFPHYQHVDLKSSEARERFEAGPLGILAVWPGPPNMPRNMVLTILFYFVSAVFIAYVACNAERMASSFAEVFQLTATVAVMTYAFGSIPNAIWFRKPPRAIITEFLDGVVMGLVTGGIFAVLWPSPSTTVSIVL